MKTLLDRRKFLNSAKSMVVNFPILIKYKKQFYQLMEHLEKCGMRWRTGIKPTEFVFDDHEDLTFPIYILYDKDCKGIVFLNQQEEEDFLEDLKPVSIDFTCYKG